MASIFNDDDSTDDEFGVNLQLAERLRINRGDNSNFVEDTRFENGKDFKQYCNMRRKKFAQEGQSSSSSSLEIQNDNTTSGVTSSDSYHNKKRQNGDKNIEPLANPKRTCLSDRFRRSPECRDLRKKASKQDSQTKHSKFSETLHVQSKTSPDLFPDKRNDEHVNSLADAEDSDFEFPVKITRNLKKNSGHSSKINKNHRSQSPDMIQLSNFESKPSTSYLGKFLESGSDDESKPVVQNGALKGGRQEPSDHTYYAKRLFGRKVNKKVLDSDESGDGNMVSVYRSRPLVYSSSDSEDFRPNASKNKHGGSASNGAEGHSHSYGDSYDKNGHRSSRQYKTFRPNQKFPKRTYCAIPSSRADSSDGCDRQFLSSDFQRKITPTRPCRTRRSPRMNIAANITSNGFANGNNSSSAPVRGRRISGSERGTRRSGSPHHRSHRPQPRSDDIKCRGRSVSSSRNPKIKPSYVSRYPDVFDAEESDNEFFTANSYSDTETSTESVGGLTINANFPNHRGGSISCSINCEDAFFDDGSTDDEISVVFSTGPYGRNDSRRGASRTLGRRYSRGTPHRQLQNSQEVVSLSPDPVEQVRQVEEDERMARMLQAQFDAEVDPDYTPFNVVEPLDESDGEIVDPISDPDSSEGGIGYRQSSPPYGILPLPARGFRINRFSTRPGTPNSLSSGIYFGRWRNRRRFPAARERNDWQLARLFGLGMPTMSDFFGGGDEYETLLSLDLGGDVIPRGLPKTEINRLPTRKYVHPNSASSSTGSEVTHKRTELNKECQVCLTDYETGDILRILPCFHEFHTPCIDPWLKINHTCPVCRVTVDLDT